MNLIVCAQSFSRLNVSSLSLIVLRLGERQTVERMAALNVSLRPIDGPWDGGWVLDKHIVSSKYLGEDERGNSLYDTTRTEVGQATFQLKYRSDWEQAKGLAGHCQLYLPKIHAGRHHRSDAGIEAALAAARH